MEYLGENIFIESSGVTGISETSYSMIDGNEIKNISTVKMSDKVFGEGISRLPGGSNFVRMTWLDNIVDILDSNLRTIETIPMFTGVKEGWGITHNENTLYVSDGSPTITLVNANSLETEG